MCRIGNGYWPIVRSIWLDIDQVLYLLRDEKPSSAHAFVFDYILEFGYYILFAARGNELNHCETINDNEPYF